MQEFSVADGMSRSVFESKYARKRPDGRMQTYGERISEVIDGNFSLDPRWTHISSTPDLFSEYQRTQALAKAGIMPTSGRHLQHGDKDQSSKLIDLHSNCATAMFSFMLFRLLLRGSGVGRDYSSACCRTDWSLMPDVRLVLNEQHPDFRWEEFRGGLEPLREARHKYDSDSERVRWFEVGDSREGWAKIIEILETAAWQGKHADKLFIFDFSKVREAGAPIMGLQGRPASGPIPLMNAISQVASIKAAGYPMWLQALYIDHYIAAAVQFGGARRSARMSVKSWKDRDIVRFIDIKRGGFLWSSNNSVLVDREFWADASKPQHTHARRVFEAVVNASYFDGTGEPGFINVDLMNTNMDGMDQITSKNYINQKTFVDLHPRTLDMIDNVLMHVKRIKQPFIVNPCSEIVLSTLGGLCIIGDINLSRVEELPEAIDAVDLMAKFLVRVNLMKADYEAEVKRTNRIGVALTGIHEFAWTRFGLTFWDLIDYYPAVFDLASAKPPEDYKAHAFWQFINQLRASAEAGAEAISRVLGLVIPHTTTTIKPSGTISKVMSCTEVAHHFLDIEGVNIHFSKFAGKGVTELV